MKKIILFIIPFLMITIGCHKGDRVSNKIINEVESLTADIQKRVFLEKILKQDQKVRKDVTSLEVKYGYDSKEAKKALQKRMEVDKLNLQKITLYLEKYGHPTVGRHGELATGVPWILIHHSGSLKPRKENFRHLYTAYKNGDLRPGSFSFYLGRFHSVKFGKRFTLPNPYREEQLIDSLIKRLNLKVPSE